ncbi:hypothetical protein A3844_03060 [Paenibacillus helianthi]|uniref:Polysaccharide biosynthesis protein C-terminal domain-containing protein n=1 Tax=Paenibacillus helianthi TaxID=1349432 RepID=A0ABX3EW57_9BACL|nr:hypothetical protein A3848_12985 [Paenibacillus sp. P32E]OKP90853.1 hypothetical protein A3844_03060 [Paenibacillus helianthi]
MSITQGVLYIPVIILLQKFFGLHGVICSMTVTEVITSVMGLVPFILFSRKLKNMEPEEEIKGVPGTSPGI